jgi:hypothetical protein
MQIADGMSAAHALGMTHRDLKPGNILVTRAGQVKILDFGLAQVESDSEVSEPDATATMALTDPGTAIGTVAYMSPEQARGMKVDARSDLWSLGVILYEMATRTRPFQGPTTPVVFEGILTKTPVPVREKNPKIPVDLERIIAKLLEKDRETRYQSAADVRADLKRVERDSSGAAVATAIVSQPVVPTAEPAQSTRWRIYALAAGALVLAAGGFFLWQRTPAAPLTDTDMLVLADVTNTTGDPVFDGTVREALSFQLDESPFLKTLPDSQVRQALQRMSRSPDERVTNAVADEICQREGLKATIGGSIASLGNTYTITLQATNCQSGDTLAREQAEAADKGQVLKAVATAARAMREKLGESLSSIQRVSQTDADKVTTSSLEAFDAYSMGAQEFRKGTLLASIPLLKRATELDPNFASAWYYLGAAAAVAGTGNAAQYTAKAYELRDRVSERERLTIEAFYFQAIQQWDKFGDATAVWARTYPRWALPHNQRGFYHRGLGELEEELKDFQAAYSLEQTTAYVANLTRAYIKVGRFDEAKTVVEKALAQGLLSGDLHGLSLTIGYLQGDRTAQQREIAWFSGKPEEYIGLALQAQQALLLGQRTAAADLRRRAAEAARRQNVTAAAAQLSAPDFLSEALLGNCAPARTGPVPLALALCADAAQVEAVIDATTKRQPLATIWNSIRVPIIRAAMELKGDQPAKAIELLQPILHYERSYPEAIYLRGLAYLRAGKGQEAAAEFQKLIGYKGITWGTLYYPLAHLGVARATQTKKSYQDFFALWKDADQDIPILMEARKEYAALQ